MDISSDYKDLDVWANNNKVNAKRLHKALLGIKELIYSKKKAGREQDILDIKKLKGSL